MYSDAIQEIDTLLRDPIYLKCLLEKINDIVTRENWEKQKNPSKKSLIVKAEIKLRSNRLDSFESEVILDSRDRILFQKLKLMVDYIVSTDYDDCLTFETYCQEDTKKESRDKSDFLISGKGFRLMDIYPEPSFSKPNKAISTTTLSLSMYSSAVNKHYSESFKISIFHALINCAKAIS